MRRFRPPPVAVTLAAALVLAAAGCASTGTAPIESATHNTQATVRMDGGTTPAYQVRMTHSDPAVEDDLLASPDRAFATLPLVYEQLGLKINTAVSDTRTIGVTAARTRRVGKDLLSRFVSCGFDVTGTPLADSYSVLLTVLSRVTPSGTTGSLLSTQVLATARPLGTSGAPLTCQSTGVLEGRIAKSTLLRTAG